MNNKTEMIKAFLLAIDSHNSELLLRLILGYVKDDNFWDSAPMEQLELLNEILQLLVGGKGDE